jgi:hypothetical protein
MLTHHSVKRGILRAVPFPGHDRLTSRSVPSHRCSWEQRGGGPHAIAPSLSGPRVNADSPGHSDVKEPSGLALGIHGCP